MTNRKCPILPDPQCSINDLCCLCFLLLNSSSSSPGGPFSARLYFWFPLLTARPSYPIRHSPTHKRKFPGTFPAPCPSYLPKRAFGHGVSSWFGWNGCPLSPGNRCRLGQDNN